MKRHNNKYWKREKEYISLLMELDRLYDTSFDYKRWKRTSNSEIDQIRRKLRFKFYHLYYGWYNTAPKHYRKQLNRSRRKESKNTLRRELQGYEVSYNDNYKDASWYW